MGFLDKVTSFVKREANDVGDAAEKAKDKLDDELSKREAELAMTPSEKIAALQSDAEATDAKFDAIAAKATGQAAHADAVAEVAAGDDQPSVTQIVLPDGSVHSGDDVEIDDDEWYDATLGQDQPAVTAAPTDTLADVKAPALDPESDVQLESDQHAEVEPAPDARVDIAQLPPPPFVFEAPEEPAEAADAKAEPPLPVEAEAEGAQLPPPPVEFEAPEEPVDVTQLPPPPVGSEAPEEPVEVVDVWADPDSPADSASADLDSPEAGSESVGVPPVDLAVLPPPPSSVVDAGGRVVAELDVEDAPMPQADTKTPDGDVADDIKGPDYGKTPAQIKYEQAREAANELLAELRGELEADGKI